MPAIQLNAAQRREQRAASHHLDPVVLIGGDGLTAAVRKEADAALNAHGLIKVRVFSDDRAARDAMLADLADTLNAAPVQHIGKLLVLWRPIPLKEKTPREERGGPTRVIKVLKFSKSGNHRPQVKKLTVRGNERLTAGGLVKRGKKRPVQTSPKKKSLAQT
jgi:putative YhbY family RNA-binding protein